MVTHRCDVRLRVASFVALGANLDRGKGVVADQRPDVALGDLGQAFLRDVGDDPVPLPAPAVGALSIIALKMRPELSPRNGKVPVAIS